MGNDLEEGGIIAATGPDAVTKFYLANRARFPEVILPPRPLFHPWIHRGGLGHEWAEDGIGAHLCWGSWRSKPLVAKARTFLTRKWTALA